MGNGKDKGIDDSLLQKQRGSLVRWLRDKGYIQTDAVANAVLKVPREDFVPPSMRDLSYSETPLPIPGKNATISCIHTYCIYYEALGLGPGDNILEVGLGSGYGAALARELVGPSGRVVSIELDPETYRFGVANLRRAGYDDVITVLGDGSEGHAELAPYDKISITAACPDDPEAVIEQLQRPGCIIYPVGGDGFQYLMKMEVDEEGGRRSERLTTVIYVPLRGKYGKK